MLARPRRIVVSLSAALLSCAVVVAPTSAQAAGPSVAGSAVAAGRVAALTAGPTTVTLDVAVQNGTTTLTATTDAPVDGAASLWVGIYDRTTGARFGYCSTGTVCTLSGIVPAGGGAHTAVAAVGAIPPTWTGSTTGLILSSDVQLAPWLASLTSTTAANGTLTLAAATNYQVASGYLLGIYDRTTGERFGYCSSGMVCTLTDVVPHGGGLHEAVAAVGPTPPSWSQTGNWAVSPGVALAPWSVSLASAAGADGSLTLTGTANYPVNGGAGFWLGIYDRTTGERLGYCATGTECRLIGVVLRGAATHELVASVGPVPTSWNAASMWAVSTPATPDAWRVSLASTQAADGTLTLTATTNYPVNGTASYWVGIYDRTTGERLGYCSSGTVCAVANVVPKGAGPHDYVAGAGPIPVTWSQTGLWAVSTVVTPAEWAVSLTYAATGSTYTLTATANYPVSGAAGESITVYNTTTGQRLGSCTTGLTCVLTGITLADPSSAMLVATVGPSPVQYSTSGNWAVSNPVNPVTWTVALQSDVAADGTLTLSATTNYAVNAAVGISVGIYDRTTGARLRSCTTGAVCTVTGVVPQGGGSHDLIAAVGSAPAQWSETGNRAVSNVVTPAVWSVSIVTAPGQDGSLTVTATSNYPVNGGAGYATGVYDQTTGTLIGSCASGTVCTLTSVVPRGGGAHQWVAAVGPTPAAWTPTANWAASSVVTLDAWSVVLTSTAAADGSLTLTATTNYPVAAVSGYSLGVYDRTTGERMGSCATGTSCTLASVVPHGSGSHALLAAVGPTPTTWDAGAAWVASTTVSAAPWSVTLAGTTAGDGTLTLTAQSSYPVNGSAGFTLGVYDQTTGAQLGSCSTGTVCTVARITGGGHQFVAGAGPLTAQWGGGAAAWAVSNVVSSSRPPMLNLTFDTGTENWINWFGTTVTQDGADAHSGAGSLKAAVQDSFAGIQTGSWPGYTGYSGGSAYTFSLWHRSAAGSVGSFDWYLVWLDAGGNLIRMDTVPITPGATWGQSSATVTAPEGTVSVWLALNSGGTSTAGSVLRLDDVTITAAG